MKSTNNKQMTLLTSAQCGPCFMLKNKLKAKGLEVKTLCFSDPANHEFFRKHEVKSVPALVVEDESSVHIVRGIDDIIEEIEKNLKDS
jgi:glutaredoxin